MVEERRQAIDPPPEEATFMVEEEANPPRPRTRHEKLEIFDRFLTSHELDNSTDAN